MDKSATLTRDKSSAVWTRTKLFDIPEATAKFNTWPPFCLICPIMLAKSSLSLPDSSRQALLPMVTPYGKNLFPFIDNTSGDLLAPVEP